MADFQSAFEKTMRNEGGFILHKVPGDSGGRTYAGIAENYHRDWPGWSVIDTGGTDSPQLTELVKEFYIQKFWNIMKGDNMQKQLIAESIFDFGVNAGMKTAIKIAQTVCGTIPDGVIGLMTLGKLDVMDEELFIAQFALAKIARYANIVKRNRSQSKFLLGWIIRTLKSIE